VAEGGLLLLAADFYQFILVLVAIDFSSWVVLPWAFYDKVKGVGWERELRWLKEAQGLLFISGIFFIFGFLASVATEIPNPSAYVFYLLPLVQFLVFIFGFMMMFLGMYDGFRLVNAVSGIVGREERILFKTMFLPVILFNIVLTLLQISLILGDYFSPLTRVAFVYLVLLIVSFVGSFLSLGWLDYLLLAQNRSNARASWAISFLILPYVVMAIFVGLFHFGIVL
jgi:hypothetical protein